MARVNNKARLAASVANLSPAAAGKLADFIETLAVSGQAEEIGDIETSVRASRRGKKAAVEEKPARRSRRAKAEVEDEKPARKTRRSRAVADEAEEKPARRSRRAKPEILVDDTTIDDLYDIIEAFEGEPVAGTLRDLKPEVEAYGMDMREFPYSAEDLGRAEKAEEVGMFLAACKALAAQIAATLKADPESLDELLEDLGIENKGSAAALAKKVLIELNAPSDDEDEDDQDEGDDEGDEDEDEDDVEEVAPKRRSRRAAKAEEKPARKSRRAAKDELEDEDDLGDLDELDE